MGFFDKLKQGLTKTKESLNGKINNVIINVNINIINNILPVIFFFI